MTRLTKFQISTPMSDTGVVLLVVYFMMLVIYVLVS